MTNADMVFDPSEPDIEIDTVFPKQDWSDTVYGHCEEELPHNMTAEERGLGFKIVVYVDSGHAGDNSTRRS